MLSSNQDELLPQHPQKLFSLYLHGYFVHVFRQYINIFQVFCMTISMKVCDLVLSKTSLINNLSKREVNALGQKTHI